MANFTAPGQKALLPKPLQKLVPEIREDDLVSGGAGVRAQACDKTGGLLDDFRILENPSGRERMQCTIAGSHRLDFHWRIDCPNGRQEFWINSAVGCG